MKTNMTGTQNKTKKIWLAALFAMTLLIGSSTPSLAGDKKDIPHFKGVESFIKTFPQATDVNFMVKQQYIEVNFTWNNMQLQAFYDLDGSYIGTSRQIDVKDMPLPHLMSIKKEYANFKPIEAIEFSQEGNGLSYYVTVVAPQKMYVLQIAADGTISVFKKMKN
ncbi:hypothetical protein ACX0G9_16955 [Flavitalea flava]